jgi:hypothetical protein
MSSSENESENMTLESALMKVLDIPERLRVAETQIEVTKSRLDKLEAMSDKIDKIVENQVREGAKLDNILKLYGNGPGTCPACLAHTVSIDQLQAARNKILGFAAAISFVFGSAGAAIVKLVIK